MSPISVEFSCVTLSVVQLLSHVQLFATQWTVACQASLSFTISWSLLKLRLIELVMPSNHLIHHCPILFLPPIFPSIRAFSSELVLNISGQSTWSCCPRDSQESFPVPQFENINFLALSLLYGPALTSVNDYWKNHSFDYIDLCWQSDVSAF